MCVCAVREPGPYCVVQGLIVKPQLLTNPNHHTPSHPLACPVGYVRTRMTKGQGLIDASESVAGLISVLEGNAGPLNGQWYDYAGKVIPW